MKTGPAPGTEATPITPDHHTGEQPFEYQLLTGHYRTDGSYKSTAVLKEEYVHLTDNLVHKMTNGVEVEDRTTGERTIEKPDWVIWLDKSARPVAWLTKELWPTLAAEADGTVPPMPHFGFVNIDRKQWLSTVDPLDTGQIDINKVDQDRIRSLRSIFVSPAHKDEIEDTTNERLDTAPAYLDNKTVLIVDEVQSTGRTLRIAQGLFERAFPTAKVATSHWMGSLTAKGVGVGNADLPVWYKDDTPEGRGIGDIDMRLSTSPYEYKGKLVDRSRTQRLGAAFLGTALKGDPKSAQLRQEIHQLAVDVRAHKVLVLPSLHRPDEEIDERVERLNDMPIEQFITQRAASRQSGK